MPYSLNTSISSKLLFINSSKIPTNQFRNGSKTAFTVMLDDPIACNEGEHILMSLYSCSIPNTMYSTRASETSFTFTIHNGMLINTFTVNILPGNYSVKQVYNAINAKMAEISVDFQCLTFSYLPQYNKTMLAFKSNLNVDRIDVDFSKSSLGPTLGWGSEVITLLDGQSVVSPNMVQIYDQYSIFLRTSLETQSYNEQGRVSNILERIPISSQNSVTFFQAGITQHKTLLSTKSIKSFDIFLTTHDEAEVVDLNGCPFELCLKFDIIAGLGRADVVDFRDLVDGLQAQTTDAS